MAISYLDNLNIRKKAPNVERDLFATVDDMVAWSENYLPDIFPCYVVETGKRYVFNRSNSDDPVLGKWREDSGSGGGDMSNYYTKNETDTLLGDKVNTEVDKGLSTNDFTDTYKDKIGDNLLDTTATDLSSAVNELKGVDDVVKADIDKLKDGLDAVNKKPALIVDEKPVYDDSQSPNTITYKQDGISNTIEATEIWFCYDENNDHLQTIWIGGREWTIASQGINTEEYVNKLTDIVDGLESIATDKVLSANQGKILSDLISGKVAIEQGEENANKSLATNELGQVVLVEKQTGEVDAENVNYAYDTHPEWNNVKKALDGLIEKVEYVKPSITAFTMTPSTTDYEVGQTVTELDFAWTYNKSVKTQSLSDVQLADENVRSGKWQGNLTTSKTFTLNCSDGQNNASASKTISFKHRIYYGSASIPEQFDSAFILGLANKPFATSYKGKYNITVGGGQYGFIACPSNWNIPNTCKISGFGTDLIDCGTYSFTNASGGTTNYKIVRTSQAGLGAIEMLFE